MRKQLLTLLLLWPALMVSAQQVVRLGKATYASKAPLSVSRTADHGGDQTQYMQYRKLYIKEQTGRPIPTNDWWTDLINADRGRSGQEVTGHLWAYPQYVQGMRYGVDVHYPKYWIDNGTEMKAQSKLVVSGGDGFTAAQPLAEEWSDWTVGFSLLPHGAADFLSADKGMFVTLEHGVPFTWIETKGISPVLSVQKTGNDGSDNRLKGATTVKLLTADGTTLTSGACQQFIVAIGATDAFSSTADYYGIYLPAGSTVTVDGSEVTVNFSGQRQFVVVALLTKPEDLAEFASYAYAKPTNTEVSWNYDNGRLTTYWNVSATDLRTGSSASQVLQGQIPHHWRDQYAQYGHSFLDQTYLTPRGRLKLVAQKNISISYRFSGMLPWYPAPADETGGAAGTYDPAKMTQMLTDYAQTGTFGGDTYWGGKGLTQMALHMAFAREMGNEELFAQCHDRLKEALVNWLTYTPGENNYFFARDNRYGGLIGYATSYDSDTYNDHHFHYGYFTLAAAMLCLVDDDFKEGYGEMLKLIARDYNNYERDSWACFLRMMDPWAGHCYAGGMGDGAGNGQESTSESMQAWGGMYLLGVALGDTELRDAGIFGWVNESRATAEYWFDRHGEAVGSSFHTGNNPEYNIDYSKFKHTNPNYTIPYSSNLTSHGVGWWTWFGGDPVFMQGIQWMPISPALDYLGEDKAFAAWDYQRLMELKEHAGWDGTGGTGGATLRDSDWGNVVLSYRQWSDPDEAARIFDQGWSGGWGTMTTSATRGITYFVTHSHRAYGDILWDVTANIPTAHAYQKGSTTYHVAYNPTSTTASVNFSDGASMSVPPRQMKVLERDYTAVTTVYPVDNSEPDIREELVMRNLALGKPCTASSSENAGSLPEGATDGSLTTRWGSSHADNEWLQVNLGEQALIYKVRIRWEAAYASEYRIELRDTENGAVTFSKTGSGKPSDWTELNLGDKPGQYLRVVGVKRGTQYGTSLYELEVYGQPLSAQANDLMGVSITCSKDVLTQGEAAQLFVKGYNYAKSEVPVTATWSSPDGSFSGNWFTPHQYGLVTVKATVDGMEATKTLAVEEGLEPTSLEVAIDGDPIIGQTVGFSATVRDQFGAPYETNYMTYELFEVVDGNRQTTTNAVLDTEAKTFRADRAGDYVIVVSASGLQQSVDVRGIGPSGLSYDEIPPVQPAPSMSGKLPLLVRQTVPNDMAFGWNGSSKLGTDHFPVPTIGGGTTNALFVYQLGTVGFGLNNLDISGYNMIHADIYVTDDAPTFSFHVEGKPSNKEYAKALVKGQWNTVDLPITNTTINWLFLAFSDYQAGTNEALVANVYLYKEEGDRVFVSDPDAKGIVTVTSFGAAINDTNVEQFLADVEALPTTATAIDLSGITLANSAPMTITTQNPNVILLLNGSGGDDNAASVQTARLTNNENLAYNSGGWILPLQATGYKVTFTDGYPVLPMSFGRCTRLYYTRTIAPGAYGTSCLPREVTIPSGLSAYELGSVTSSGLDFVKTTGSTMAAYTPYLLRNDGTTPVTLTIDGTAGNVELARGRAQLTSTVGNVSLVGNFQLFRVNGTEGYAAFRANGQLAWLSNSGTTVGSFRAYLSGLTAEQAAQVFVDGTTGIDNVNVNVNPNPNPNANNAQPSTLHAQPYYDLSGRRVEHPTKGVYIVNGKKVVIR